MITKQTVENGGGGGENWENFCEQWFNKLTMSGICPLILSVVEGSKNFDWVTRRKQRVT